MEGMLVIISGPSGSGKGTVVKELDPANGYAVSISVTTRKPRPGEVDGKDYFFITEEEFANMREENKLLEHFAYVGNYYGTPRPYVEDQIVKGKIVVLEIEVNGALQVKEKFPEAVLVFLMPPTFTELERRLVNRGTENAVTIEDRLKQSMEEVPLIHQYDYLVINDKVHSAVAKVDAIANAERLRPKRNKQTIKDFASSQVQMDFYTL
ncbi:MAG: guanylate kinase [Defluviitaleaceae bacterium]|nr:guanylate kinase [Defluviitaleaceae bacterium]